LVERAEDRGLNVESRAAQQHAVADELTRTVQLWDDLSDPQKAQGSAVGYQEAASTLVVKCLCNPGARFFAASEFAAAPRHFAPASPTEQQKIIRVATKMRVSLFAT